MPNTLVRRRSTAPTVTAAPDRTYAAAGICDQHGAGLLALATALVGDPRVGEAVVLDVISAGFPATAMAVPMPVVEMRRQLSRRVYLHCAHRPVRGEGQAGWERAALALTHHGRLTYRAAAELMELPPAEVAQALATALRNTADPHS